MQSPPCVLVTDDEEDLRTLWRLHLTRGGFRVCEAANGQQALDVARVDRPDVILLDVMMPVKDGWECLSDLQRDPDLCDVPVVILTGKVQAEDQQRAFQLGAKAFVTKPFEAQALIARLRELIS